MILTTTPTIEGHPISQYVGLVTGEAVMGTNFVKDFFAQIRDVVGGRSGTYEDELRKAREICYAELAEEATRLRADAVVGIQLNYETVGGKGSMLMVTATGTAVTLTR